MTESSPDTRLLHHGQSPMSDDLLALLRYRIATRFYDQPQVVDRIARAILRGGHLETNAFSGV